MTGIDALRARFFRGCVPALFHGIGHSHDFHVVHVRESVDVRALPAAASNKAYANLFHRKISFFLILA